MQPRTSLRLKCLLLVLVLGLGAGAHRLQAQVNQRLQRSQYNRAAIYRYAEADDLTVQVYVWGAVQNAGIYEIPQGTTLNTLFSAAGGPSLRVRQRSDSQTIQVELKRKRETGEGYRVVYQETMENEIIVPGQNPALQEGDVLTVQSFVERGFSWRDLLGIGTSVASLVLTAVSIATR